MDRYFAVLKEKRTHAFPRGTIVLPTAPQEDFGGRKRTERLYVYPLDLEAEQLTDGPETFRLAAEVRFPHALRGEPLLSLGELEAAERRVEDRERELATERRRERDRWREREDDEP